MVDARIYRELMEANAVEVMSYASKRAYRKVEDPPGSRKYRLWDYRGERPMSASRGEPPEVPGVDWELDRRSGLWMPIVHCLDPDTRKPIRVVSGPMERFVVHESGRIYHYDARRFLVDFRDAGYAGRWERRP